MKHARILCGASESQTDGHRAATRHSSAGCSAPRFSTRILNACRVRPESECRIVESSIEYSRSALPAKARTLRRRRHTHTLGVSVCVSLTRRVELHSCTLARAHARSHGITHALHYIHVYIEHGSAHSPDNLLHSQLQLRGCGSSAEITAKRAIGKRDALASKLICVEYASPSSRGAFNRSCRAFERITTFRTHTRELK